MHEDQLAALFDSLAIGVDWQRTGCIEHVSGGDIAQAFRVESRQGPLFLKLGRHTHPFDAEVESLRMLAATNTLRVPAVIAQGTFEQAGYMLLEWIELQDHGDWRAAGEQLAALHAVTAPQYGAARDNSIGSTPQLNTPSSNWAEFWRERRLRPQFGLARAQGYTNLAERAEQAYAASDALLHAHRPPAALLHGDLWRGNLAFDAQGRPVLFDPACYHGDAETDLAMTRLFGGFPAEFYQAYGKPRDAQRERLYQLYHVLNHANLFGDGYVMQAQRMIDSFA